MVNNLIYSIEFYDVFFSRTHRCGQLALDFSFNYRFAMLIRLTYVMIGPPYSSRTRIDEKKRSETTQQKWNQIVSLLRLYILLRLCCLSLVCHDDCRIEWKRRKKSSTLSSASQGDSPQLSTLSSVFKCFLFSYANCKTHIFIFCMDIFPFSIVCFNHCESIQHTFFSALIWKQKHTKETQSATKWWWRRGSTSEGDTKLNEVKAKKHIHTQKTFVEIFISFFSHSLKLFTFTWK